MTVSGAGSNVICNNSIVGEDGFDKGFPEMEKRVLCLEIFWASDYLRVADGWRKL